MPTSSLPLEIKSFLNEFFESVANLEVVLMLHSRPDEAWSAEKLYHELRSNVRSIEKQLIQLEKLGLVKSDDKKHYYYQPETPEIDKKMKLLVEVYKEKPVAVVAGIYEKTNDQLRGFSNAFKIKKD